MVLSGFETFLFFKLDQLDLTPVCLRFSFKTLNLNFYTGCLFIFNIYLVAKICDHSGEGIVGWKKVPSLWMLQAQITCYEANGFIWLRSFRGWVCGLKDLLSAWCNCLWIIATTIWILWAFYESASHEPYRLPSHLWIASDINLDQNSRSSEMSLLPAMRAGKLWLLNQQFKITELGHIA